MHSASMFLAFALVSVKSFFPFYDHRKRTGGKGLAASEQLWGSPLALRIKKHNRWSRSL